MNKKITYFLLMAALLVLVFLVLIFSTEKYFELTDSTTYGIRRFIRLKEVNPLRSGFIIPSDSEMRYSGGSLIKRKYKIRVDRNGFIMPSQKHDKPDLSIVFLGGSTTKCEYVTEENRFPYLVGSILEKKTGKKINSYNGGVGGNYSLHSIDILLNKVIPMKPDIVVLMHNINDLNVLVYEKTYWNNNPFRSPIVNESLSTVFHRFSKDLGIAIIPNISARIGSLVQSLKLFSTDEFKDVRGKKRSIKKQKLVSEFRMNLQTFISICKIRKIIPVLMTQANRIKKNPTQLFDQMIKESITNKLAGFGIINPYERYKEVYDLFNQSIRDLGKENKVLIVDLAIEIPQDKKYIYDSAHFNDTGSKLAAQIISEGLYPVVSTIHLPKKRE